MAEGEGAIVKVEGYRVEHRRSDGTVRELLQTTMRTQAMLDAYRLARRLRTQGEGGTVVMIRITTQQVIGNFPVADPSLPPRGTP